MAFVRGFISLSGTGFLPVIQLTLFEQGVYGKVGSLVTKISQGHFVVGILDCKHGFSGFNEGCNLGTPPSLKQLSTVAQSTRPQSRLVGVVLQADPQPAHMSCFGQPAVISELVIGCQCQAGGVGKSVQVIRINAVNNLSLRRGPAGQSSEAPASQSGDVQPAFARPAGVIPAKDVFREV